MQNQNEVTVNLTKIPVLYKKWEVHVFNSKGTIMRRVVSETEAKDIELLNLK